MAVSEKNRFETERFGFLSACHRFFDGARRAVQAKSYRHEDLLLLIKSDMPFANI
jgi:hypothetical protein